MTAKRTARSLKAKALALLSARAEAKACHVRADALLAELLAAVPLGESIRIGPGRAVVLVDQFAEKDVVWKAAGVRRFDIKEVTDAA